jgi:hypothetical protein
MAAPPGAIGDKTKESKKRSSIFQDHFHVLSMTILQLALQDRSYEQ